MATIDQAAARPLNPAQRRALALMEVDVYQRRRMPRLSGSAPPVEAASLAVWSEAECADPLAQAIARAGGAADARAWSAAWSQSGLPLPDLAELRGTPAAKRVLWRQMRSRR